MAILGYARVSRGDQAAANQRPALLEAGATKIFTDEGVSGATPPASRPAFAELLTYAREGDEIVAYRLDRIARNAAAALALVEDLDGRGITLRTIADGLSTRGTTGRLVLTIIAAIAEMERSVVRERTLAGLDRVRAQGRPLGRKPSLTGDAVMLANRLRREGVSAAQVARQLGTSKSTIIRITRGYDA
ncbi:recombinase family protein [Microbacterium lacus]|uniref:recombinase family protein n=1 Tax=Microbacterium lacus TaxID=415217 RepID=UPI00384EC088